MGFISKIRSGWNAFKDNNTVPDLGGTETLGVVNRFNPSRFRLSVGTDRTILASIYTRLSIDVAAVEFRHARLDDEGRYKEDIDSELQERLVLEANVDQAARQFRQDIALTLFEKGVAAIVPVEVTSNPQHGNSYDILSLRVGHITEWYPRHVKVNVYNDINGERQDVVLPKTYVAIVTNPLYNVMNEPNSTLQRLIQKISLSDTLDEEASAGKLDLIIQLPYVIKSEARRQQAEERRKDIEVQLSGSKYGIAYTDGTERITQLNRPVENNLPKEIETLTQQLYAQLGLTPSIFDGTADEAAMLNYNNRTIEPIVAAVAEAMERTFLTKTARKQGQSIEYFTDPFKLVPISDIAEIADKFTRNEIMSSNEIRSIIGRKPSADPKADELRNSNMPAPEDSGLVEEGSEENGSLQMSAFDEVDEMITNILTELGVSDDEELE